MKQPRYLPFAAFGALSLFGVLVAGTGCHTDSTTSITPPVSASTPSPEETANPVLPKTSPSPSANDGRTATVYRVKKGVEGAQLEPVMISLPADQVKTPATFVMNAMASGKDSPLPKGTQVKLVKVEGDLATVDFNDAFQKNFEGGDRNEAVVFNAVTETLGQFPNVKRVQILVDGKKVSVGGTQDTTEPIPVGDSTSGG